MIVASFVCGASVWLIIEPSARSIPERPQPIAAEPSGAANSGDLIVTGEIPSFAYGSGTMWHAVSGDFDGDGDVDGAVFQSNQGQHRDPDRVTILLNQSDGTFSLSQEYPSAPVPANRPLPHMEDFDGDGDIDLLVRSTNGLVGYLPNTGSGLFDEGAAVWSAVSAGEFNSSIDSIVTGDIDGDGDIDLVYTDVQSGDRFDIQILPNDGSGVFVAGPVVAQDARLDKAVSVYDINDDGFLDIGWAERVNGQMMVAYGMAGLSFAPPVSVGDSFPGDNRIPAFADVDGDGVTDIVFGFRNRSPGISVLFGDGLGGFATPAAQNQDAVATDLLLPTDLDGDGDTDFVWRPLVGYRLVGKLINDGSGNFERGQYVGAFSGAKQQLLIDADADGDLDVLAIGNDRYSVVINGGNGEFEGPVVIPLSPVGAMVAAVDLDNDGNAEVVSAGSKVDILPIVGGELGAPVGSYVGLGALASMAFADLDSDGYLDFVAVDSQANMLTTRLNNGDGSLSVATDYLAAGQPTDVSTADTDGDGDLDVVVGYADSDPSVFLNDGAGGLSSPQTIAVAARGSVRVLDMNGDAFLDVFRTMPSAAVFLNDPNNPGSYSPVSTAVSWPVFALGDVDDDGDIDIAWGTFSDDPNGFDSGVAFSLNDGQGAFVAGGTGWSTNEQYSFGRIFVQDLDGDGDTDILALAGISFYYLLKDADGQSYSASSVLHTTLSHAQDLLDIEGDGFVDAVVLDDFSSSASLLSVSLPPSCPADLTGEGILNFFDISTFITLFNANDPIADFHADGLFNFFDVADYIAAFNNGCP